MSGLIGYNADQVPANGMLGRLAFVNSVPLNGIITSVNTIADLRAFDGSIGDNVFVYGRSAPGDFGGGYFRQSPTAVTDDDGINIVANDGTSWTRIYDGINVLAAWFGLMPGVTDAGLYFANLPKYCYVHFLPGSYIFLTYPTEAQFQNRFYRGMSTVWRCNGVLADDVSGNHTPAFTWSYAPSQNFGIDSSSNNINDMINAGVSPIEGIAIIGNSNTTGIGFQFGNSGLNNYFIRPKNFSIQNFATGFMWKRTMTNAFLTGLENVVLKGNGTNLICDNTDINNPNNPGGVNSGENFYFKSCYFGNATVCGAVVTKLQLATFDNCSFDYCRRMAQFFNSNVKMKNCYVEGTPKLSASNGTWNTWFDVQGVSCLDVDSGTNIYILNGSDTEQNSWDIFNVYSGGFGNPNVRCNASVFSSPLRFKPLSSSWTMNVFGSTMRCNGGTYPTIVSESVNMFPDVRLSRTDLSWYPNSTNATLFTTNPQPYSGATQAIKLTPPSTTQGASFVMPKVPVTPGREVYVQFLSAMGGSNLPTQRINIQWFNAEGVHLTATTFTTGDYAATFTAATSSFARRSSAALVPVGATTAIITLSVDPLINAGDVNAWYIGTIYVWQ